MIVEAFEFMAKNPVPGCLVEFGVWRGDGLEQIEFLMRRDLGGGIPVYGFDSFEGMPHTDVELKDNHSIVWAPGGYADTSIEAVAARLPTVRLVKAIFSDLKPLKEYGIDKVRFARIDCDIYEGYRDSLRLLTPHLQIGSVLLFDEGLAPDDPRYHDSIRDSGERAIREWLNETGFKLRVLQSQWTEFLAVIESRAE